MQRLKPSLPFVRLLLSAALLLGLAILGLLFRELSLMGRSPFSGRWLVLFGIGSIGWLGAAAVLIGTWLPLREALRRWLEFAWDLLQRLRLINLLFFAILAGIFCFLVVGPYGRYLEYLPLRFAVFLFFALAGSVFLGTSGLAGEWWEALLASALLLGAGYRIAAYAPDVSAYPFSLNWSEASRYYYASLFFAERIYGIWVPPSALHPTRYLMQSLPFLIPGSPLWLHRLWQVVLWVTVTFLSGWVVARRLKISPPIRRWAFLAWVFLFLLMGPVYYHLQIMIILVVALFNPGKLWQSLGVVILASIWAGLSRINWFPMPAMLGIALYLLEVPVSEKPVWRYLMKPLAWGLAGLSAAFISQALYSLLSGNPSEHFTSSLTSDLLWYRLLPNPTYRLGVLPAAILVSAPLIALICDHLRNNIHTIHVVRLIGLGVMLLILLGGGLIVSVKIGGGSNLHNLDAYLTLLMLSAAYIYFEGVNKEALDKDKPVTQSSSADSVVFKSLTTLMFGLTVLLPLYFALLVGEALPRYDYAQANQAIERLARLIQNDAKGEVLFITERHLLTFQNLRGISLVPDYEKVFLMEMAMAGNGDYLGRFYEDLKEKRFDLIVTEPLFLRLKGRSEAFGEENDAWVKRVSEPVLCYYKPYRMLREVRLQLLVPREDPKDCDLSHVLGQKSP